MIECVCVSRLYAHICQCLTDLSQPTTYSCSSSLLCKLVSWMFLRSSFGDVLEFLFVFAVMFFWTTFSSFSQRRGKMRGNFGTFFHTCVLSLYVCTNAHIHTHTYECTYFTWVLIRKFLHKYTYACIHLCRNTRRMFRTISNFFLRIFLLDYVATRKYFLFPYRKKFTISKDTPGYVVVSSSFLISSEMLYSYVLSVLALRRTFLI